MITDAEHAKIDKSAKICFDMYWDEDVAVYGVKAAAYRLFMNGAFAGLKVADSRKDGRDGKF